MVESGMATEQHVTLPPVRIMYPCGKDGYWHCACSCGKYDSGSYAYAGYAEMAATAHAKAKNAAAIAAGRRHA